MHRNEERATKLLQITYDINLICFQMDFFLNERKNANG